MTKILLVEDDEDIARVVIYNLEREKFSVVWSQDSANALNSIRNEKFSAMILDVMLPGIDGYDLLRLIRMEDKSVPTIFVSAKTQEEDILKGLNLGADDYVIKPFSPKILITKVKQLIKRREIQGESTPILEDEGLKSHSIASRIDSEQVNNQESGRIRLSEIILDPDRHEVTVEGKYVELTSTEFKILHVLMKKPGWVFSRYRIVDEVHGEYYSVTDRSVDVQIAGLRKKLGSRGRVIETVRGVGYKFVDSSNLKVQDSVGSMN